MACVEFTKNEDGTINANVTVADSNGIDGYFTFNLIAACHLALIQTLNAIWPDWIDYNQYIERMAEEELIRQAQAY